MKASDITRVADLLDQLARHRRSLQGLSQVPLATNGVHLAFRYEVPVEGITKPERPEKVVCHTDFTPDEVEGFRSEASRILTDRIGRVSAELRTLGVNPDL